jgi:hypothetical protein
MFDTKGIELTDVSRITSLVNTHVVRVIITFTSSLLIIMVRGNILNFSKQGVLSSSYPPLRFYLNVLNSLKIILLLYLCM